MNKHLILALGLALTSGAALAQATPAVPATPATPSSESNDRNSRDNNKDENNQTLPATGTKADAPMQKAFTDMDRNTDGRLSREEVRNDNQLTQRFQSLDTNRDGNLSEEEYSVSASGSASPDSGVKGSADMKRKEKNK